jgi:hypothetical protein
VRKATRNYLLALGMALLALFQAVSGFVLWAVLPRGYMGGRGEESAFLWTRDSWINLHDWTAVALVIIVLVHVILHRRWIVWMTRSYFRPK